KETSNRRDTLRKIEKYSNKLGRLVDDMEKNANRDENISTYGKRLLHVVCNSFFFLKKKEKSFKYLYAFFVESRFKRNMKRSDPITKNCVQQMHYQMLEHHPRLPQPQPQLL